MQYIQSDYKGSDKKLNVLLLNDLHIGAPSADITLLDKCIKFAYENQDNTRILLNGDYIEGVTKLSKGNIYEQTMSPRDQIDFIVDKLRSVSHLIDGVSIGNHDWRIETETSIDIVEMLTKYLGIQNKYVGSQGIISFYVNKAYFTVDMHHGSGGGSTIAAVENSMKKLWKSDSDVMYCGHWHKEFSKTVKRYTIDNRYKKVKEEKRLYVCGNTILNTAEYAKRGGYEESFPSQAVLEFSLSKMEKSIDVYWIRQ